MILALAGGVGGAKLARGLADILPAGQLSIVVNTGDDFEHLGLHISPDLDTVMYTLAGMNDPVQGWGIDGETWNFMQALERLGGQTWFRLGDRDLATHVERTQRLRAGASLSAVTRYLCQQLEIAHTLAPMSDDPVRTLVHTVHEVLSFQDYFVRRHCEPRIDNLVYSGAEQARMSETLCGALEHDALKAIVICPSNPYLSIAPVLALPGMRAALQRRRCPAIAVSPIIGGQALKGPAAKIMRELGRDASSLEVARFYRGLVDVLVIDEADESLAKPIEALGVRVAVTNTVMKEPRECTALAKHLLDSVVASRHWSAV
jgi:LPPG:FO 2-phospho-L-lactate transferase